MIQKQLFKGALQNAQLSKVDNRNTKARSKICSKLTNKTPERRKSNISYHLIRTRTNFLRKPFSVDCFKWFNLLSTNLTKRSNTLKQFVGNSRVNLPRCICRMDQSVLADIHTDSVLVTFSSDLQLFNSSPSITDVSSIGVGLSDFEIALS